MVGEWASLVKRAFWVIASAYVYHPWSMRFQRIKMHTVLLGLYPCEHRGKNPQQEIGKPDSTVNTTTHCSRAGFIPGMQGWFDSHAATNGIHRVDQVKDKNHENTCRCREKASDKIQHPFVREVSRKQVWREHISP